MLLRILCVFKCFTESEPRHSLICWIALQETDHAAGIDDVMCASRKQIT